MEVFLVSWTDCELVSEEAIWLLALGPWILYVEDSTTRAYRGHNQTVEQGKGRYRSSVPATNQIFQKVFFNMAGMKYKEQASIRGPGPNGKPLPNSAPTEQLCSEQEQAYCIRKIRLHCISSQRPFCTSPISHSRYSAIFFFKVGRRKKDPPETWPWFWIHWQWNWN